MWGLLCEAFVFAFSTSFQLGGGMNCANDHDDLERRWVEMRVGSF